MVDTYDPFMSDRVGSAIKVGHGRKCGDSHGIDSPSVSIQKLFPLPVSWPTFEFPMSADVGQCRQCYM